MEARTYRFGSYDVDPARGELRRRGTRVRIQEKPLQVLLALVERPGDIVTREELRGRLWAPGVHVEFDESLNAAVRRLRRALGDEAEPARFVETIPRRGYRLLVPVERVGCEPPPLPETSQTPNDVAARPSASRSRRPALAAGLALVLATLTAVAQRGASAPGPAADRPRVVLAVLPFERLCADPASDYLSDGLTEELITQLGRLQPERLGVVARTSAMRFRGSSLDVREIAHELGADYVLEGSVRCAADRVRIAAHLVDVRSRTQVWSEAYDRGPRDLMQVQLDLGRAVARTLAVDLMPGDQAALARAGTTSGDAYDAYLRGLHELRRGTATGFANARELFGSAVAADRSYALGEWGLAEVALRETHFRLRPPDTAREAVAGAERALALDPHLPQAWATLAEAQHLLGNRGEAARAFARGLAAGLLPPEARLEYAWFLHDEHRDDEALAEVARAQELDPASPEVRTARAHLLLLAGRTEAAARMAAEAVDRDPAYPYAHYAQGLVYDKQGRRADAIAAFERAHAVGDGAPKYALRLGVAYADAGRKDDARRMLEEARVAARVRHVPADELECLSSRLAPNPTVASR